MMGMEHTVQQIGDDPVLSRSDVQPGAERSAFSQFAIVAVDRQTARLSSALTGVAESIETLVDRADPPLDDVFRGYGSAASDRLKTLAARIDDQNAAEMLGNIRRAAVDHPVATVGIGAAVGAAFGLAVITLGRRSPTPHGN
jgi:ElaB/YqjD/DUF883 family membrane-anchored ribosome-binding protein